MQNRTVVLLLLCVLAGSLLRAAAAASAPPVAANQPVYDFRLGLPDIGSGPARLAGSPAPDFALPTLDTYLNTASPAKVDTVRLSAFRGKKSVVLLFTGHT